MKLTDDQQQELQATLQQTNIAHSGPDTAPRRPDELPPYRAMIYGSAPRAPFNPPAYQPRFVTTPDPVPPQLSFAGRMYRAALHILAFAFVAAGALAFVFVVLPAANYYATGTFPDLDKQLEYFSAAAGADRVAVKSGDPMAYDLTLLSRVSIALGSITVRATQRFWGAPILVEPTTSNYPSLPYGLIMPLAVHGSELKDDAKYRTRWATKK